MVCEMCNRKDSKRRIDNLFLCNKCNEKFPSDRLIRVIKTKSQGRL